MTERRHDPTFGISIESTWYIHYAVQLAELAETQGFSNIWVTDGGPSPPYSDPIVTLSAIASKTKKIKLGTAILNYYTRNPASIASSFLALSDLASHGSDRSSSQRAILGLGVGSPYNVNKFGVGRRRGMINDLREAVESIRDLFRGKEVTVRTDSFTIDGVILSKAKHDIPVQIGSRSPRGLRLAGEIADGVILTNRVPSEIEDSMKHVYLGLADKSRLRRNLEITNSVVISIDENKKKAENAARTTCAYLVAWMNDEKAELQGLDVGLKNKIARLINLGEETSAASLVTQNMLDLLTVSGTVEDCVPKCREHLRYGIDHIAFCEPFGPVPKRSITTIARRLIPKI